MEKDTTHSEHKEHLLEIPKVVLLLHRRTETRPGIREAVHGGAAGRRKLQKQNPFLQVVGVADSPPLEPVHHLLFIRRAQALVQVTGAEDIRIEDPVDKPGRVFWSSGNDAHDDDSVWKARL